MINQIGNEIYDNTTVCMYLIHRQPKVTYRAVGTKRLRLLVDR